MIDISSKSSDPRATRLSNFTARRFNFDGVPCASIEGPLQALKYPEEDIQQEVCMLSGKDAKRRGAEVENWSDSLLLYWRGRPFSRLGEKHRRIVTDVYDSAYEQDSTFIEDLLAIGHEEIRHTMGRSSMLQTVLTEVEMLYQINRLRIRALGTAP